MKVDLDKVNIGKGLGSLTFGLSRAEVELLFRKPDKEDHEIDEYEDYFAWHYCSEEISLYFDRDDDYRLGSILCERISLRLFDSPIIGINLDDLTSLIEKNVEDRLLLEYEYEDDNGYIISQYSIDRISLSFWFKSSLVESVQLGYLWVDKNTPLWPLGVEGSPIRGSGQINNILP